jgi:hypothetical protein
VVVKKMFHYVAAERPGFELSHSFTDRVRIREKSMRRLNVNSQMTFFTGRRQAV